MIIRAVDQCYGGGGFSQALRAAQAAEARADDDDPGQSWSNRGHVLVNGRERSRTRRRFSSSDRIPPPRKARMARNMSK